MILRELHLRRILFGRILIRRRPVDRAASERFSSTFRAALCRTRPVTRGPAPATPCRRDEVARLDACLPRQAQGHEGQQCDAPDDYRFANPQCPQLHSNLRMSPETFSSWPRFKMTLASIFHLLCLLLERTDADVNASNYALVNFTSCVPRGTGLCDARSRFLRIWTRLDDRALTATPQESRWRHCVRTDETQLRRDISRRSLLAGVQPFGFRATAIDASSRVSIL